MDTGEQLLESLKDGRKIDSLLHRIEGYLMPVSKVKSKMTLQHGTMYGAFAMKMLRACIERLSNTKPGSQELASVLQISEQCYQCVCQTRKHIKTIPLALEKLLFHTMAQTLSKRLLSDAQRVASSLYDELNRSRSKFLSETGVDNEYDTIVKQAFNKLWKACLDLEQSSQGQHALKHTLILNVRLQALQFLMLTDYECSWVVERALRAAVDFDRKSSKSASDQDQLHVFLSTVLDLLLEDQKMTKKVTEEEGSADKNVMQLFELGLQAVKYSIRAARFDEALEICDKLDISLQKPSKKNEYIKQDSLHGQCVMIIKTGLQIKQRKSISCIDSLADSLQSVTSDVSKVVEKTTITGPGLNCLLEACEILKKSLGGSTDSQQQQKTALRLPGCLQEPVYDMMMLYVDLLQVQKEQLSATAKESREAAKSQSQQIQRNVNRQLNTLDFLSTMLLDKIKSHSINTSQDTDAASKDKSEDERCLEKAIQVCHRTKAIIDDVASGGGGALPAEENRWFGSSAYNLGLVCYKRKSYCQATFLLDIACNQLQTWCFTANKVDKEKITKVQLLSRYELLIGCQRKGNQHIDAMQTAVKCLWNICSHMTDQVTPCIELWVKAKRDALKTSGNEHVQSRTLFDAIKDIESNLNEDHRAYISLLLKKELQAYKTQRHDTTVEQHSVVCDLLSLNSNDDTQLAYCHALVEQAQLLRVGNFESDKHDTTVEQHSVVCDLLSLNSNDDTQLAYCHALVEQAQLLRVGNFESDKHDTTVEQHSVVCDLLSLNSNDDTQLAYCHALVEQAQLLRVGNFESDKSSCECCSEAIDILTELVEEESTNKESSDNPQGLVAFDLLATAYFWIYVCQMEEAQLSNTETPESKSEQDPKATIISTEGGVVPHVACNLAMEHASMQYLDMALGIWQDILCKGFNIDKAFHDTSTTSQCLKLMASLYELMQRPLQQLQSLSLLSVLTTSTGNRPQSVYAYCQLSRTLCHLGQTKLAGSILWKAEEILGSMEADGGAGSNGMMESEDVSKRKSLELSCMLAKAEYLLYDGQFDSFQSKMEKLIQSQTSERRTYHTYLHNASIKQLQAICMDISTKVMTPNLCPEGQTSMGFAVEAMRIRTGVCSNLLGESFCSRQQQVEGAKANNISTTEINVHEESYDQWSILSAVLESLLQVGKLHCQQGCVREAEGYLYEGLVIANKYLLPRRCAEFCLQLSKVYTMKGQLCQAQLNQMKQFVNNSKDATTTKTLSHGAHKGTVKSARRGSSKTSLGDNSEDEDFIQSKRMSLSDLVLADNVTSSPTLKSQTIKLPAYHTHGSECSCQSCSDVVLHQRDIEYFAAQARSSLMQGELLEASTEVDTVMRFANWIVTRDDKMTLSIVKVLSDDGDGKDKNSSKQKKNVKLPVQKSVVHIHDQIILELKALNIQVLLLQNKPMKAQQSIDGALGMFTKDISPVILTGTMKAELQYYQVITNLSQQGCDVYTNAWKQLQSQSNESILSNQLEDLSMDFGKLELTDTGVRGRKGVCGSKPSVAWQDRADGGVGRPELSRKDLVTPMAQVFTSGGIGIFCDPDDDGDRTQLEGACAIMNTPKPAGCQKSKVQASTKKGILSYSVKKKSQKIPPVIWEDQPQQTSQKAMSAFSLDNDVFGFDSPSIASKKTKSVRKAKSAKAVTSIKKTTKPRAKSQKSKVEFADSDHESNDKGPVLPGNDEDMSQLKTTKSSEISVFSLDNEKQKGTNKSKAKPKRKINQRAVDIDYEEKYSDEDSDSPPINKGPARKSNARTGTARKTTARKGSTAKKVEKKPAFVLSESDVDPTDQPKVSKTRKKKSESAQDDENKDVKPKGRGRKKLPVQKEDVGEEMGDVEEMVIKKSSRPRRGRRANVETARAEDDDDLEVESFDILMEENCILLPVDLSPVCENSSDVSCQSYSDLDLSCDNPSNNDTSDTVSSTVDITIRSAISDVLLLEDLEEIEIPRAGPDSEEEDVSRGTRRKKATTSKKPSGRRRLAKKLVDGDDDGVEMMRASTQVTEELSNKDRAGKTGNVKQQHDILGDSDLAPVIQQLEQIYNAIKPSAPVILYRQVCHMLALCHGDQSPAIAVRYLNEAMSVTLRHKKVDSLTKRIRKAKKESGTTDAEQLAANLAKMSLAPDNNKNRKKKTTNAKQAPMSNLELLEMERNRFVFHDVSSQDNGSDVVKETLEVLPEGWTICMLSVVSPGVYSGKVPSDSDFLVLSRLAGNKQPLMLKVPMQQCDLGSRGSKLSSSRTILEEFDAILVENKESVKETDKKIWWSSRQRLDERMEALTKDMESNLFGCWKGIMLGQSKDHEYRNKLEHAAKELQTALEASCEEAHIDQHLCECLLASAYKLNKRELTETLSRLSGHKPSSEEHTALMRIFRQLCDKVSRSSDDGDDDKRHPVILILDKQIQQLPWENMPIVKEQPMCRMPSLHFIQSHLKTMSQQCTSSSGSDLKMTLSSRGIQQNNTFFVLNPSNDLANTQKMFRKWFEKDNGWNGVVARAPTKEEYMSALTDHDLFVYCGHGNGREFLTGDDIQRLCCKAATLLIGCSSGKLHVNGCLEAYGMALNYLLAGCPCVVANLWDVTDRDIDRFLEELLKSWLSSDKTTSLPDYINQARQACKLQNLIGCSPVVYGLPVHMN